MAGNILKQVDADVATIPAVTVSKGDTERDRVMKLIAHAYLRLWTRLALESGFRLRLSPMQFVLGTYEGQMNWHLNEAVDFKRIAQLELGGKFKKKHGLVAETYELKGEERVRLFFALEEEEVKNRPVLVSYLVHDSSLDDFDVKAAVDALKPVLPAWLETITSADDAPLWNWCKEKLECVGI
jgi:hypothetical protein